MAGEDWLKGPRIKISIDYGWSSDEIAVKLYQSGFALVEKKTHTVIPVEDAKRLVEALGKTNFKGLQEKVGLERARDGTHVKLRYEDSKNANELWWDYTLEPATKKLDKMVDEIIELTRPKKDEKK